MTAAAAGSVHELSLRRPLAISIGAHLLAATVFVVTRPASAPPAPPTYRVSLVAAPPGPRAAGVVEPPPAVQPPSPEPVAPPPAARTAPATAPPKAPAKGPAKVAPKAKAPKQATPAAPTAAAATRAPATPAPRAGGGPAGGAGADVANVQVAGIAFPYPGYLENVVRQIALRFKPPSGPSLTATVAFLIRRDGTVSHIRLTKRSGVYSFDTEAMGAVDAAAQARAFGPLPQGFSDDVLPVIFSFDPRLIH